MSKKPVNAVIRSFFVASCFVLSMESYGADTGVQELASSRDSLDVWVADCPSGSAGIQASVADLNPPSNPSAKLRVIVVKDFAAALAEDNRPTGRGGEGGGESRLAKLSMGHGSYTVNYFKTGEGPEKYRSKLMCWSLDSAGHKHLINPSRLELTDDDLAPDSVGSP